jgi:predicted metal-dependent HD superfamily phosphohydrolase
MRVRELVLITKHRAKPVGADACLLVDIDLSILGAPMERFDEYEAQVRQEYGWVAEKDFRNGRGAILREFLTHKSIYLTELFRKLLEANAKTNLERSLKRLGMVKGAAIIATGV